jgi:hypothetical protein
MTTKRKIKKFSQSLKEINQIYQSIPNLMRQAHKEMNPATAAALTTALVWSRILDVMLVRAHADEKLQIRARIAKA